MSVAKRFLEWLTEMAFARDAWIERARDDFMKGALMEFTCYKIAQEFGFPDNWSDEVNRLLAKVHELMDTSKTKTTAGFDREKALAEAMEEASSNQGQIVAAKNKMAGYYPNDWKKIKALRWNSEEVFAEMVEEFLPKYAHLLKK